VAAVVLTNGDGAHPKSLFDTCLEGLERNSVPSYIQMVDAIPKTVSEKNLDRLLKEDFRKDADNVYKLEDTL